MSVDQFRSLFSKQPAKYIYAILIGVTIPIATSIGSDLLYLHDAHEKAAAVSAQLETLRISQPLVIQRLDIYEKNMQEAIKAIKDLSNEIHAEREERIREKRR